MKQASNVGLPLHNPNNGRIMALEIYSQTKMLGKYNELGNHVNCILVRKKVEALFWWSLLL